MTTRGDDQIQDDLADRFGQGCDAYVSCIRSHVGKDSGAAEGAAAWRRVGLNFSLERLRGANTQDWREALLKCIAIILTRETDGSDAAASKALDREHFHLVLDNLRVDFAGTVRAQATLVAVTCLKLAPEPTEAHLKSYVISRVERQKPCGLIEAFSAAAALFPALPATGAALFLAEGFVAELRSRTEASNSETLRRAALELLSAACTDGGCREAIARECTGWLEKVKNTSGGDDADRTDSALAAVVLTKIQYKNRPDVDDLTSKFKEMLVSEDLLSLSIEGLAYRSTDPKAKERLCEDSEFLKLLVSKVKDSNTGPKADATAVFGGLTVLSNLTIRQPKQSAEQRRMAQLKAYANKTAAPASANALESDSSVSKRCVAVIGAGVVPLLVAVAAKATLSLANVIATILDSISVPQSTRGTIAQQGAFDLALRLSAISSPSSSSSTGQTAETVKQITHKASLALARILVKLDPHLLFSPSRPPSTAIKPLHALLRTQSDPEHGDLWPVLESLMALTNLATLSDGSHVSVGDDITDTCWDDIEAALLSSALPVRRAAVQCVCNLSCASEKAVDKFADLDGGGEVEGKATAAAAAGESAKRKQRRVALLVAFTHPDEDRGVLLSASAALASLLGFAGVAERFAKAEGSVEKAVRLVVGRSDDNGDLKARGVAMFEALLLTPLPPVMAAAATAGGGEGDEDDNTRARRVRAEVKERVRRAAVAAAGAGGIEAFAEAGGPEMRKALGA